MPPPYLSIPRPEDWQTDSYVTLAIRRNDTVLRRIDNLLLQHARNEGNSLEAQLNRQCVLCNLYFTIDYWLKIYRTNFHMASGRADVVNALYKVVVDELCTPEIFACKINSLPRELERMFGRQLSADGYGVDFLDNACLYMDKYMTNKSKLEFRGGLAYGYGWRLDGKGRLAVPTNKMARVNSRDLAAPNTRREDFRLPWFNDFAFFVMSMSRDFYMRQHYLGRWETLPDQPGVIEFSAGLYHSSYLGDQAVMFAGSLLIENGVVKKIRPDSGHFKPVDSNMVAVLWALQMHGVSLHDVMVYDYNGNNPMWADTFLRFNGDWMKLLAAAELTTQAHREGFAARNNPRPPTAPPLSSSARARLDSIEAREARAGAGAAAPAAQDLARPAAADLAAVPYGIYAGAGAAAQAVPVLARDATPDAARASSAASASSGAPRPYGIYETPG
jgi:hypothetical protein